MSLKNTIVIHGFAEWQFSDFVGKLLTIADALGLESSQGEAYKSLIKQEVWGLWESPKFIEDKTLNFENPRQRKTGQVS